jgi:hypothetical protein
MQSLWQNTHNHAFCLRLRLRLLRRFVLLFLPSLCVHIIPLLHLRFFCAECTYDHFNASSNCPCCNKTLGADDFLELVIADPSSSSQQGSLKTTFQSMFTKYSTSASAVSHREMCARILRSMDDDRRSVKFLFKQFVRETASNGARSGHLGTQVQQMTAEITQLKQAANAQHILQQKTVQDLQHKLSALAASCKQQQNKITERETQITQYREIFAQQSGAGLVPMSSHSVNSSGNPTSSGGGKRGRSPAVQHQLQPPMQGFVKQRQAHELAKQEQLNAITRGRSPFDRIGINGGGQITATPIRPAMMLVPGSSRRSDASTAIPSTPHTRDFTATGYRFMAASSSSGRPQQQTHHVDKQPRMSLAHSPSMAFAYNSTSRNLGHQHAQSHFSNQRGGLPPSSSRSSFQSTGNGGGYGGHR